MKTRKEIEEQNRKQHILNCAEHLFAEKGLQNTSVADIAQAAEFGVGTLYKYFKDKNTLISSWAEQRISEHFSALESVLKKDGTPPEVIEGFIAAYIKSMQRRRPFFKIYFTSLHPANDNDTMILGLKKLEERKMELFRRVDDIYKKGIDEGYFLNVGNAAYLTAATWGMLMAFYFMAELRFKDSINVDEMQRVAKQLLFDQVRLSA